MNRVLIIHTSNHCRLKPVFELRSYSEKKNNTMAKAPPAKKPASKKTDAKKSKAAKPTTPGAKGKVTKKTATSAAKAKKDVKKVASKATGAGKKAASAGKKAPKAAEAGTSAAGGEKKLSAAKQKKQALESLPKMTKAQEAALMQLYEDSPKSRGRPPAPALILVRALELPGAADIMKGKIPPRSASADKKKKAEKAGDKEAKKKAPAAKKPKTTNNNAKSAKGSSSTSSASKVKAGGVVKKPAATKKTKKTLKEVTESAGKIVATLSNEADKAGAASGTADHGAEPGAAGEAGGEGEKGAGMMNGGAERSGVSTASSTNGALTMSKVAPKPFPGADFVKALPHNAAYVLKNRAGALAHYPHMRKVGGWIYVSGVSSRRPDNTWEGVTFQDDGSVVTDIRVQTEAVIRNICTILGAAGATKAHLVDLTCFLVNMKDYAGFNDVYNKFFDAEGGPSRTTVAVAQLPSEHLLIEIKAVAYLPEGEK